MMNKNNSVSTGFPATPIPMPKDVEEQISNIRICAQISQTWWEKGDKGDCISSP